MPNAKRPSRPTMTYARHNPGPKPAKIVPKEQVNGKESK